VNVVAIVLGPPQLALRTLDDFHRLAVAAERSTRFIEAIPFELVERALDDLNRLAVAAQSLESVERRLSSTEKAVLERTAMLERQLGTVIDLAGRVERTLPRIDEVVRPLLTLGPAVDALSVSTRTLAAAVEPLQGASERLGKLADRIPRARSKTTT
jgi:hypothetical protein